MPPQKKPFGGLSRQQQQRIVQNVADIFHAHCPTVQDDESLLRSVVAKCQSILVSFSGRVAAAELETLACNLGALRSSMSEYFRRSRIHLPSISVSQLDRAVCQCKLGMQQLNEWSYSIFQRAYTSVLQDNPPSSESSSRNLGGRPSKVSDPSLVALVDGKIRKRLPDSERVLVIGRGESKQMVLAQHLIARRRVIPVRARTEQENEHTGLSQNLEDPFPSCEGSPPFNGHLPLSC